MKIPTKFLPPHLKQFTRKKTFFLWIGEEREIKTPSYWDGGSRDEWAVYQKLQQHWIRMIANTQTAPPPFNDRRTFEKVRNGRVVVQFGTFMGKPATLKVHCVNIADVLNPTLLNDPDFIEEFIDEPNLIAQLRAAKCDS